MRMLLKKTFKQSIYFCLLLNATCLWASDFAERKEVKAFAKKFADENKKDVATVLSIFESGVKQQSIITAISRPAEKTKTWGEYRKIFIENERIEKGVIFWQENLETLKIVSEKYQVPPEIIVAIIGIETRYGRIAGSYKVLDALLTLSFDYEPRAPFFQEQLTAYLLMCEEQKLDPTVLKGSYAGAMGYGQFMPSSYRNYAVDFEGDGVVDIWTNQKDAIASVANYFTKHGWKYGNLVALQLLEPVTNEELISQTLEPVLTIKMLRKEKVVVPAEIADDEKVTVMKLETESGMEYWLGFDNFYTISRYNHSKLYSLSVYQLSQILKARMDNANK